MLSAFTAEPIVELKQRDKSKIDSILAHGDQLFVGLNTGSLRIYRTIEPPSRADDSSTDNDEHRRPSTKTELLREYEKFSKYKIEQLAVFKEANILVSLSAGVVSIHDLGTFELQQVLAKTKGASTFAATSNIVNDPTTGVPSLVSTLAVAVKRRLLLWSWHDGELTTEAQEIALVNGIKSLTWATGSKVVAGLQSNYVMVDIETQKTKPLYGPGSIGGGPEQDNSRLGGIGSGTMSYIGMGSMVPNPLATGLGQDEMLLARDINSHFIDRSGEPIGRRQIPWRSAPHAIGYSYPFLLVLQDSAKGVLEVRNPQTLTTLQVIDLPAATLLQVPNPNISLAHQGKGFLVASERVVWRMQGLNYDAQVDYLVESAAFDEAISLLQMIEETLIHDKAGRLREIKMQKAQKLFDDKKFRNALDLFGEVSAPPDRVIQMYPELISGDLAIKSVPSSPVKTHKQTPSIASLRALKQDDAASIRSARPPRDELSDKDLKLAVRELQLFLADVRRRLQPFFNVDQSVKDIGEVQANAQAEDIRTVTKYLLGFDSLEGVDIAERLLEVATRVDTTLFRAHMYATPSLAGSLFRISNFCDPDVVITKLEDSDRYGDLIDFLYGKRLHRRALEMLQKFGKADKTEDIDASLHGPERTVTYLQNLSPELIELILEFAEWPLKSNPSLGMAVFITDTEIAEHLPRDKVLAFLERVDKSLALQYLEHVVDEWNDSTPELHQKLLSLYLDILKRTSGAEKDEMLSKFLTMLKSSAQYSPGKMLGMLPKDDPTFFEATAIVFSKMRQHKQALQIYVFKLQNIAKAEEYCNQIHVEESAKNDNLLASRRKSSSTDPAEEEYSIYHMLLNLYLNPPNGEKALVRPAIDLMARHGPRLPASSTLEMIPNDLLINELEFYFRGRIRNANTAMNDAKIVAGLRKVDNVRLQAGLLLGEEDSTVHSNGGRQRKVKVDEDRVCGVCYKRLGSSVISVFPDNSVVHLGCANRRQTELTARA